MRAVLADLGIWVKDGQRYSLRRSSTEETREQVVADALAAGYSFSGLDAISKAKIRQISRVTASAKGEMYSGIELASGFRLPTDVQTRQAITDAKVELDENPAYVLENWHKPDGDFIDVQPAQITMAYNKIRLHTKAVRLRLRQLVGQIMAATTVEEVQNIVW